MKNKIMKIGIVFGLVFILVGATNLFLRPARSGDIPSPPQQPALVKGDLIFMESDDWTDPGIIQDIGENTINDHVVLYIGLDTINGVTDYWCISAGMLESGSGVGYTRLSYYTNPEHYEELLIARVMTTQTVRNNAIDWAREHADENDPYQNWFGKLGIVVRPLKCANPYDPFIPSADEWYCSELVWAAYFNQGIDIDNNGWGLLPYGIPCVNMGVPNVGLIPDWLEPLLPFLPEYAYENEIQIDDNIHLIPWT